MGLWKIMALILRINHIRKVFYGTDQLDWTYCRKVPAFSCPRLDVSAACLRGPVEY